MTFCDTLSTDPSILYLPGETPANDAEESWYDEEFNVECMLHDRPVRPHSDASGKPAARHRGPQLVPDGLKEDEHLRAALALQHPYIVDTPSTYAVNLAISGKRMNTEQLTAWRVEVLRVLVF